MSRLARTILMVVAVLASIGGATTIWGQDASAGNSKDQNIVGPLCPTVRLPDAGSRVLGFTSEIAISQDTTAGYIPVKITLDAVGRFPADRRLVYRFVTHPGGQTPPQNGLTVDVPVAVQQGSTRHSVVRYLPKWSAGQALQIAVYEEGRLLEDYQGFAGTTVSIGRHPSSGLLLDESLINWLFISADDEPAADSISDLRQNLLEGVKGVLPGADATILNRTIEMIGQRELTLDWRGYQRYDAILIRTAGLRRLSENEAAYQAVRDWILAGGTMIVIDAESPASVLQSLQFRRTDDVDSANRIAAFATQYESSAQEEENQIAQWVDQLEIHINMLKSQQAMDSSNPAAVFNSRAYQSDGLWLPDDIKSAGKTMESLQADWKQSQGRPVLSPEQWREQIWLQPTGAGRVIGIKQSDQYAVPPLSHWRIVTTLMGFRASPMLRRGVDPLLGDQRFSRWLIPGVAQPPVYTFMGLLTAFVVLVGPVAYRKTAKVGRSYLMFAIAPMLALFTTLAMFGYGIVSDGFGTAVRIRQLTFVDGASGDGAERVRSTYFAGVRPSDGLRFPGDAEVIWYPEGTGKSWEEQHQRSPAILGSIVVRDDLQILDSSLLPSRQQRQFIVHQPRNKVGSLQLAVDPGGVLPPTVESSFGFRLHEVVMRDDQGVYWTVENLVTNESTACQPLPVNAASKALGRLYNDHRPLSAVRESRQTRNNYSRDTFDNIVEANQRVDDTLLITDGVFEFWLQQQMQTAGEIPRGYFVATADVSPDVLAVDGCELVESIRYVFGTLR